MVAKLGKVYLDLKRVIVVMPPNMDFDLDERSYEVLIEGADDTFEIYEQPQEDDTQPTLPYDVFIDIWKGSVDY